MTSQNPNVEKDGDTAANPSRRKFLQGAAVAAAAAAAAGTATAVVAGAAHQDLKHAIQTFGVSNGLISGAGGGTCLTGTSSPYGPLTTPNTIHYKTGEKEFMLWFWINNVLESPSGVTYTLSYTITEVSGPGPAPGTFPAPFAYSGGGSDQHNYVLSDNTASCPGTVATANASGSDLAGIASVTLTGSASTRKDILWQLHMNWPSSSGTFTSSTIYQFNGTVTDSMGNTFSSSIQLTVEP
jgi:hypothetical protein